MYKNFNNYEIFEDGKIWSKVSKKFLKPIKQKNGYLYVSLYDDNGKLHVERLHKVIYFAVNGLWEYPERMQINHLDEDKMNNQIGNLLLCSPKENVNWGTGNERRSKAMKGNTNRPQKRVGAYKNGELVMVFPSTNEAGRQGYDQGNVAACCRGERKTHKGYIWKYLEGEEN